MQDPQDQVRRRHRQVQGQVEVEKAHLQPEEGLTNGKQPFPALFLRPVAPTTQCLDDYDNNASA
jgi:hypothetical protein